MVERHHQLNGHEFEQASGVGDGQRSLACSSPWDHKESDMTEQLNLNELKSGKLISPTLFFFLKLLWLFDVFWVSIQIIKFFVLVL